jgi:hypothetical protein
MMDIISPMLIERHQAVFGDAIKQAIDERRADGLDAFNTHALEHGGKSLAQRFLVHVFSWQELVKRLRALGFEGPFAGGKHLFMLKGALRLTLPKQKRGLYLRTTRVSAR